MSALVGLYVVHSLYVHVTHQFKVIENLFCNNFIKKANHDAATVVRSFWFVEKFLEQPMEFVLDVSFDVFLKKMK